MDTITLTRPSTDIDTAPTPPLPDHSVLSLVIASGQADTLADRLRRRLVLLPGLAGAAGVQELSTLRPTVRLIVLYQRCERADVLALFQGAVTAGDPALAAALQYGMDGDHLAALQDMECAGQGLDLDRAPAGAVGNRIEIAADRDHAVVGDLAIERQDGLLLGEPSCLNVATACQGYRERETAMGVSSEVAFADFNRVPP